ncbi:MAG: alpha/beta fold hydrolase [Symbiobacterium sp.]|uniref:alpha/beta fold hydrolase n=1 Tax=Symbiobacterium sp. TaxID=1971213 RepID=UPI003464465E
MPEIHANGITLHYRWQGRMDGPVLVLINGLLTDLSSWNGHLPHLTPHFRVLTYDCRGQGLSEKPDEGPYTPRLHADDLKGLLDGLGIEKAALLGVSSGACVALSFAARWPERVSALVLANGYGVADTAMQVKLNSWLRAMEVGGGPLRFDVSVAWIWGASFLNNHYEALKPWREKGTALPAHAVIHLIRGAMEHDVLEQARNITCPTLLMTGDEDVLTPLSYSRALQERIAGSQVVVLKQAGHCMFLEHVDEFSQVAADFLRQALLA